MEEIHKPRMSCCFKKLFIVQRRNIHVFNTPDWHGETILPLAIVAIQHKFQKRAGSNYMKSRTFFIKITQRFEHIRLRSLNFIKKKQGFTINHRS